MTSRTRSIAMLAANPAFAAILGRSLEEEGGHQVASFTGIEALTTFLRISPVDLVVLDTDMPGAPAIDIAKGLRSHARLASTEFAIIALTHTPEPFHKPLLAAGIDAVLVKPVVTGRPYRLRRQPVRAAPCRGDGPGGGPAADPGAGTSSRHQRHPAVR